MPKKRGKQSRKATPKLAKKPKPRAVPKRGRPSKASRPKKLTAAQIEFARRSKASIKGWETRRRRNPAKWDRAVIVKIKEIDAAIDFIKKNVHPLMPGRSESLKGMRQGKRNLEVFGTLTPSKEEEKAHKAFAEFVFRHDMNEEGVAEAHRAWYRAKEQLRNTMEAEEWADWMTMIGREWRLPEIGPFSIASFVGS
jgi:hypothetical protein